MIRVPRPPSTHSMSTDPNDPLSVVLRPPPSESDQDRQLRLQREAEAKRISDRIDEELSLEEKKYKKSKQDIKLLLLGQAESGKSTLQKQFQLMYNPTSLEEERLSWRTVIYYNVARPIRRVFEALDAYSLLEEDEDNSMSYGTPDSAGRLDASSPQFESYPSFPSDKASSLGSPSIKSVTDAHLVSLRLRLGPLIATEKPLADKLSGGVAAAGSGKGSVFVRSGWQSRSLGLSFGKSKHRNGASRFSFSGRTSIDSAQAPPPRKEEKDPLIEDVARILEACKDDVKELWEHPAVRSLREKRKLRLEEWAEYFLDNIMRVASIGYVPSTDDILHARIQTMGVAEHVFEVNVHGRAATWHLYDVGGARGQRNSWIPYFDDANAIIFLAPISAYDQYLEEDPRTNRIDDSLQLFTNICSHPLLKRVHLVLFLNKTDVLQTKLAKGIQVRKYITSYGDRPLEFDSVVNYFKTHFTQVHKRNNDSKRVLYTHLTSVVDVQATKRIIANVSDSIFRRYLEDAALV
ncbi:G-protein alpha subunit [Abortiporus biennis]|nr:G-protein alpha subunit [Abortiporus biennis]